MYPSKQKLIRSKLEVDLLVQTGLFILFFVLSMIDIDKATFAFYFIIGGYQLLSAIVHPFLQTPTNLLPIYYVQLIIYFPLFLALFTGNIEAGFILLFCTPVTALYYLIITLNSYKHAKQ